MIPVDCADPRIRRLRGRGPGQVGENILDAPRLSERLVQLAALEPLTLHRLRHAALDSDRMLKRAQGVIGVAARLQRPDQAPVSAAPQIASAARTTPKRRAWRS